MIPGFFVGKFASFSGTKYNSYTNRNGCPISGKALC